MSRYALPAVLLLLVGVARGNPTIGAETKACSVVCQDGRAELRSPSFVFRLGTAAGLCAVEWENRLSGRKIALGGGPEVEIDLGLPGGGIKTPAWKTARLVSPPEAEGLAVFELDSDAWGAAAKVTYRWSAAEPVLRKTVEITNAGDRGWDRLLNVRLGNYRTPAKAVQREQGFPLYLDGQFFLSLAHPAGWAVVENGTVQLRQHPGAKVAPRGKFACMEAVYGVAKEGEARGAFLSHVRGRMRRTVRGHDKPYAIFEPFGARPGGDFDETEEFLLDSIAKVAQGQRESGCRFDLYSIDFWVDFRGDLKRCDPQRFPNGLARVLAELKKAGIAPGLWIDSSMTHWSIGGNPAVRPTFTHDPKSPAPGVPVMCRATEPIRSMYVEAFRHHIRENGVRLLKFDNLHAVCNNPGHEHLPGLYSTEPIQDAVIEFLHALDRECPDVFLMLYWGHRSPWWLLHADTLFDSGIGIEAASPSALPAPHVRDSVTQRLDQAQWHASDVPALGKDSLGVWLSDWGWNSSVGKERWPEGFVMDLCRGSLLAQPWSDYPWLSPPERKQMGELIALLKAQPQCFANPRFILGDPWKDEPYGYCCTDGKRAFLAIHNSAWKDSVLKLQLGPEWGLPEGRSWRIFRWHPDPARLVGPGESFGAETALAVRPFEVVLLEVVPSGQAASLDRPMPSKPIPTAFAEPSRAVEVAVEDRLAQPPAEEDAVWTVLEPAAFKAASGASLAKQKDGSLLAGGKVAQQDAYTITASTDLSRITAVRLEVLPDASLPCNGPGRAINGNLALTEFRLAAAPKGKPGSSKPVAFARAVADWSQESYGGWPIAAAIDGDPKTGWSLDPQEGLRHAAVFEANEPVGGPEGSVLTFTLEQDFREHSLGRFRLAVTTARPPLPAPKGYGPWQLVVRGQSPATAAGGLLVVTAEMKQAGAPLWLPNVGSHFQHDGKWAGRVAPWKAVLGKATYPAPWQAWRLPVEPVSAAQSFELSVSSRVSPGVQMRWSGRFVPK